MTTTNDQVILDMLKTLGNLAHEVGVMKEQIALISQILEAHTESLEDIANIRRPRL